MGDGKIFWGDKFIIVILAIIIFSISFTSASFSVGNPQDNLKSNYLAGEKISGWVNISFSNEPINGLINNEVNSVKLFDFIKNSTSNYTCNPINCMNKYIEQGNAGDLKVIDLSGEKLVGIKLNGRDINLIGFSLNISSNVAGSCESQIDIDILDDNSTNWGNNRFLVENCEVDKRAICYSGTYSEWFALTPQTYCENITLSKAPAFEIKAFIKKDTGATTFTSGLIKAQIYDKNKYLVGDCNLSAPTIEGSYASCTINYVAKEKSDNLVCISTKEISEGGNINGYNLKGRSSGAFCGFLGDPTMSNTFAADYDISVSSKKFGAIGGIILNESIFANQNNENSLIEYVNNYIYDKYKNDCSTGCVVPLKISGINQQIILNNINVQYTSTSSAGTTVNQIYDAAKTSALITSNYSKLNLDNWNFKAPNEKGNKTLIIRIDNREILRKDISVKSPDDIKITDVYPKSIAGAYQTTFTAIYLNGSVNLSSASFLWKFGDSTPDQTSSTNKVQHTYAQLGNYTIQIKLFENGIEKSSSSFKVIVKSPKEIINSTIKANKLDLDKIKNQIDAFSNEYKDKIKEKVDIDELIKDLNSIESNYKSLTSKSTTIDSEYVTIMNSLNLMHTPKSIQPSVDNEILFINDISVIEMGKIDALFDESINESLKEIYKNAIIEWSNKNIEMTLKNKVISVYYNDGIEDILSEFSIDVKPLKEIDHPVYLIIEEDKDKFIYLSESNIKETDGAIGIKFDPLGVETKNVLFAIDGNIDSFAIPIYLVPTLDKLTIINGNGEIKRESFFGRFWLPFLILLIVFLIIYIFLQEWYKKNYENNLFKSKNDLYNLIYFISNAKNQRLMNNEIRNRLKKSTWRGEQINYAIKKFEGKRVGMWEIPIFRWREKKKLNEELMKRNPRKVVY